MRTVILGERGRDVPLKGTFPQFGAEATLLPVALRPWKVDLEVGLGVRV